MNSADHFETIVSEHYEPLFRFAMSLTHSESDAGDLTQQTFFIWATKGHQLRDFSKVKTWLFTTLHRTFLTSRRRQSAFSEHNWEEIVEQSPIFPTELADETGSSPVWPALARVDEVYQAAVALFYLHDCSYKEIGAIFDVPVGTVKSRVARGVAQLREIMQSDGFRGSSLDGPESPTPHEQTYSHRHVQLMSRANEREGRGAGL